MTTRDLINAIASKDAAGIETTFNAVMADKISVQLDTMRQSVAQNMFKEQPVSEPSPAAVVEEELTVEQVEQQINEVLGKDASAGDWISDFIKSDNPKFAGKSKEERKRMALGAYYAAHPEKSNK
jgi:hypothetical protein